jgi:hypothetical protein
MFNETIANTPRTNDPTADSVICGLLLLVMLATGFWWGVMTCRGNTITRRIELRALQYFLLNPPAHGIDATVESVVKRQIRRLENRLNIDNDE